VRERGVMSMSEGGIVSARRWEGIATAGARTALRPLQLLVSAPVFLFLAALTAMLMRPPELEGFAIDRVAFALLVVGVLARSLVFRQQVFTFERATSPMLGLTALALVSLVNQPFDAETWSVLAAKFIVPFLLFHLAILVFSDERSLRQFEIFAIIVLAYLCFIAIAFLAGANFLIFPRFIVDESIGFHFDRARGPFLQASPQSGSLDEIAPGLRAHRDSRDHDSCRLAFIRSDGPGPRFSLGKPQPFTDVHRGSYRRRVGLDRLICVDQS
jgi:hypothetical protein